MVLINGVKYACERCIRGHRVTTCNHTEQPLTKIKPKGRPASQCQHCRDQRKLKSLHINCSCGKKSNHVANCYKNPNGCTCYQNHKLKALDKTKKKDPKLVSKDSTEFAKEFSPENDSKVQYRTTGVDSSGVDFALPDEKIDFNSDLFEMLNSKNDLSLDLPDFKQTLDFPLFPLIGTQSFDNENMPLSSIPDSVESSVPPESNPPQTDSTHSDAFSFKEYSELQDSNGNESPDSKSTPGSLNGTNGKFITAKRDNNSSFNSVNVSGTNLASNGNTSSIGNVNLADPYMEAYFSDHATNNSSSVPNSTSFTRSHSFKNRPSSVLSLNSTVSNESKPDNRFDSKLDTKLDSKLESSAYPPSSNSNNHSYSNLNLNITGHLALANPNPNANAKFPFTNILESNEVYVSDEELQSFWNENQELVYK